MTEPSLMRRIDGVLYRFVTRRWSAAKIGQYTEKVVRGHAETHLPAVVRHHFEVIDVKATALLTHSAMMVAAIGIVATIIAGSKFEQAIMITEIILYLLVAIACLRCSSLFREATEDGAVPSLGHELILRREIAIFCNTATIYLTILVIVTLPIVLYL